MAEHEREVIVTNDGGGGSGFGMLAGVILVLAVLAVLFFVFKDQIMGGDTNIKADVKVEAPATGG